MINVAVLCGGHSSEREISLRSAEQVSSWIRDAGFNPYLIDIRYDQWNSKEGEPLDKNDFTLLRDGKRISFDVVHPVIHGTPIEDGLLQGYFEQLNLPYTCSDTFSSSIAFNKFACKKFLADTDVVMAEDHLVNKNDFLEVTERLLDQVYFVKPNQNGSSYGVSRTGSLKELKTGVEKALEYDEEVIIEEYIAGREFSCGLVGLEDKIVVFPLTEIKPYGAYFDYDAKYKQKSDEITPALIPEELSRQCRMASIKIYKILKCKGICRADFILKEGLFYFLEMNTVPGMTATSIVPQQCEAYGWSMSELMKRVLDYTLKEDHK